MSFGISTFLTPHLHDILCENDPAHRKPEDPATNHFDSSRPVLDDGTRSILGDRAKAQHSN
jgi:hypothetical protein